jgi:hypothetical protein
VKLLITCLSNDEKTKLINLIADDCNWFADDHEKTIKFIHLLIEAGADCTKSNLYMERVIQWFGLGKLAYDEYNYLVSKGFDFSCLNVNRIRNCIKHAEQHDEDEEEIRENFIHDLKTAMGMELFSGDDEIEATLVRIESALRDYGSFNYEREGNSFLSKYEVNGKKIKITVSLE